MKRKNINIEKIIQDNRKVNPKDLEKNLKALGELQKQGVDTGPDYQLVSPFEQPTQKHSHFDENGPVLK